MDKSNTKDLNENWVKKFVFSMSYKNDTAVKHSKYSKEELLYEIINKEKCDLKTAQEIIDYMMGLGLEICKVPFDPGLYGPQYDLWRFAHLRGYVEDVHV